MLQKLAALVGRVFLALIFILSALSKIGNSEQTLVHMRQAGIPIAPFFMYAAVLVELCCGLSVATGFRARLSALILFVFLIPVTYLFHYKPAFDATTNVVDTMQMIQVLKNVAIMGGLLMLYGNGAGGLTIGKDS